ncbi:MAG: anhydro-N-acetylmuramic acid kinase [Spirosomataceae bacterium]
MNQQLQRLFEITQQPVRRIIGLMSGTSLDGLDVAFCEIAGSGGQTQVSLTHFKTVSYEEAIKEEIRKVFAKKEVDFPLLAMLNPWVGHLHADMILSCLKEWNIAPQTIDIIASHGQTVMHQPKILHRNPKFPNATLQIGDGDHIAVRTGIITLSDFRQKHCAAGGEGAPLAVYGDYFIFSKKGENRLMLNMGGIGNFTYLPASLNASEVFVSDTGPGNTLLDAFARQLFDKPYDDDAQLARQGVVNELLLTALKSDSFFTAPFPKTTGPELFSIEYVRRAQVQSHTETISAFDLMATLTRFSAETIAEAMQRVMSPVEEYYIYTSGGGMHNPLLTGWIQELLPAKTYFGKTDQLGIAGDAKEAVLFAILANETLMGGQTNFGLREGVPSVTMGKISLPN